MAGKKSERFWLPWQICLDPFMAARIRDRAERNCRKLEDEIRFLIQESLNAHEYEDFKQQSMTFSHTDSQAGLVRKG